MFTVISFPGVGTLAVSGMSLFSVLTTDLSGHLSVFCFFPAIMKRKKSVGDASAAYHAFWVNALFAFRARMKNINRNDVYREENNSTSYDLFLQYVKRCYDDAFPPQ